MKIVKNFDVLKSTKFNNVVLTLTDKKRLTATFKQ